MSIFRKNSTRAPPPATTAEDTRHPFFGRKQNSVSSANSNGNGRQLKEVNGTGKQRGSFGSGSGRMTHTFSKHDTLTHAHTKLSAAVAAEKAADEALIASRRAVKEAKLEITRLEQEAKEEAKAAQMKMKTASSLRREGDKLGKH